MRNTTSKIKEDAIVISGISGLFPSADNILELSENLYNKVDMVSSNVYPNIKHPELPQHYGKINGLEKFDAQFFRVTPKQAVSFEPCGRKLMEQAYGAIFDAGVNPETLKGSKLAVFIGFSQTDSAVTVFNHTFSNEFVMSGCSKTMLANRISYWIDSKGPSCGIDVGCASSMACLEIACRRIMSGDCDAALVAGCSYINLPILSLNIKRSGFLCLDGKTKCFDKNGNGYVRSEAVSVLFLQKAKDAKRIYSEICHVKGLYTSKPDASFLPIRDPNDIQKFLEEFYCEVDINPDDVEYIEANATGISEADRCELEGTSKIFGKKYPVKIGSIKSNLGHTESASGVMSVTKACLAYQKGELPANLHYTEPLDVPVINENKFRVVTDNTSFKRGYIAINNFGFPGANYHALLKGHFIPKITNGYKTEIPRLVLVSGRNEDGVNKVFDILEKSQIDPEQIALLNNVFKHNIPGHTGRGFAIFDHQEKESAHILSREFKFYPGTKRPVCFMYSGMGSQWAGMAKHLMQIPIFTATINKLHKVLESKGLNLLEIITNKNSDIVTNILYSLVGITAVQIGLTDILKALGITPDFIIGHSLGEIGCAYADGCFTAEQAILVSYERGYVSANTKFVKGKMAAVGLGHKKVQELIPVDIDIACHNSSESTTISGPADAVDKFIECIMDQNIFAKAVASSDIAFHSRYIANAGPHLLSLTNDLIKKPKQRGKKWISTSYTPKEWNLNKCRLASADYFTHNLLSKVHFEEGAKYIPDDAIIIEIAPHGLMQAIMKKSHPDCLNLPLIRRNHENNVKLFLEVIGRLYECGLNPNIEVLYPKVDFPVSTETPGLSHLVQWDHTNDWNVFFQNLESKTTALYAEFILSVFDDEYSYIREYFRNDENVFPESTLLVLVWKTLAMYKEVDYRDMSVEFKTIKFHGDALIKSSEVIKLCISIQKASNKFEVTIEDKLIVSGIINAINAFDKTDNEIKLHREECYLGKKDIYKLLSIHGYDIGHDNLNIRATNIDKSKAIITWRNEWTHLIESLLQFNILSESEYAPCKIKYISNLVIDVKKHIDSITCGYHGEIVHADRNTERNVTSCGGVICKSMIFTKISLMITNIQMLSQQFIPHFCNYPVDIKTAIYVNLQIVFYNSINENLNVKFLITECHVDNLIDFTEIISKMSLFDIEIDAIELNDWKNENLSIETVDLIVIADVWNNELLQNNLSKMFNDNSFVMLVGKKDEIDLQCHVNNGTVLVTSFDVDGKQILLLKKSKDFNLFKSSIISSSLYHLVYHLQKNNENSTIFILENKSFINPDSYKGAVKDILINGNPLSLIDVDKVPPFPFTDNIFLKKQVEKGLAINTLRNEQWGGYYNIPLKHKPNNKIKNVELMNKESDFNAFVWTEMPTMTDTNSVQVHYSGPCMKDIQGILQDSKMSYFGMDFSGVDATGRRVMGCVPGRAISSSVQADPDLVWSVPEHWSLEDAATVPLPYVHAYYCLTIKHVLRSNSTVLVTGGAGALGQAVISLCLSLDCKVFTIVSNNQKKSHLIRLFPQLKEKNIRFSIDTEFRDFIKSSSKDKRCDVVINCNVGAMREETLACVAPFGYFLDISEEDMRNNDFFWMGYLNEDRSYATIRLSSIFSAENTTNKKRLQSMIAEGIANGIVKPMPRTVFSQPDVSRAFKLIASRRHTGRILLNMKEDTSEQNGVHRLTLNPNKVYIVIWDGSEIGVEIINRLIERGAKNLVIQNTEKSGSGYFRAKYLIWRKLVKIECYEENLYTINGCKILIENGSKINALDGIFMISSHCEKNNDTQNTHELILSNLDFASRDKTSLSYFASVKLVPVKACNDNDFAESDKRISEREKLGLPTLSLVYRLKEMNFRLTMISAFLNGFEKSLKYQNTNILLLDNKIVTKNMSKLDRLEKYPKNKQFSDDNHSIFVDGIEEDENLATEPIVSMSTLTSEFYEDEINIDPDEHKAIVISGFLGYYKTLSKTTERLKISAIGLQILPDMDGSISTLAKNLLQYVKKRLRVKSKFYIVAYSFGVNVALEMTALLEKEGYHGIIFCLDSSPLALQHQLKAYLGHLTENKLQDFIIDHFYSQLTGTSSQSLKTDLETCENWSEKNVAFIKNIKKKVSLSHDYLNHLINAVYKRILLAVDYKPDMKLKSEIVLIKGQPDPKIEKLPDDYDLTQYTTKPVKIVNLTSDHVNMPEDCKISNIINGMLEPELLKLFEKKNLCKMYNI